MRTARLLSAAGPPVLFGIAVLVSWQLVVMVFNVKSYLLPTPVSVVEELTGNWRRIRDAAWVSGGNAFVGLVAGTTIGVSMSFLLMRFRVLSDIVNPLAVALNAVPIFVVVSVFYIQLGSASEVPRRVMVTLIVYFVVLINVAKGLRQVHPTHLELLRSYAATPFDVLRKARVPNAVPYLFTALKIAAPGAVITAFVAEYFGGKQNGLGSRITSNIQTSKTAAAWAYVFAAIAVGLVFYLVSVALESLTTTQRGTSPQGEST